jgi:DNA invertase Pin-like site-specific DNA recombinase
MHVARVYLRVSTQGQDLDRQESIIAAARDAGYYIAGVYREKVSGARADRPEPLRRSRTFSRGRLSLRRRSIASVGCLCLKLKS